MSDPRRLLDEGNGLERELLEAWSSARAPARTRAHALALVSAASITAAATTSAAASALTAAAAPATTAATTTTAASSLLLAKLAALVAITAALGATFIVVRPSAPPHSAPAATAAPPASPTVPATSPTPRPAELVAIPIDALPSASAFAPAPAPAPGPSLLSTQLTELDAIRDSLAARHPDEALAALDRFSTDHPSSPIAEEAAALRFDVQVARGDRAAAVTAARSFLALHPQSPYAARMRRAISEKP